MATMSGKHVTVSGDVVRVGWTGSVWVSPCNGQQHARARDAMRAELERLFSDSGDDIEDQETAERIERYLDRMTDAE